MHEIGSQRTTFCDLRWAERAYALSIGESTVERRVGALRLIEKLSPDPDGGKNGKNAVVRDLCKPVQAAPPEDILRLRNLQLSAIPSPTRVWKAVETWAAKNGYRQEQDVDMFAVLADATSSTAAVEEWQGAILGGPGESSAHEQVRLLRRVLAVASSPARRRGDVIPIRPRYGQH